MSNRKRRRDRWGDHYWQSAAFNQQTFYIMRDWLTSIALVRFKWVGLPSTCDARFLEWTLLTQGCATIAKPTGTDQFYSTQAVWDSAPNVYDNPTHWRSYGNNGWNFNVSPTNGVMVWDNMLRTPIMPAIEWYARELADIKRVKQINRLHVKQPFFITGPQDKVNDMLQTFKQVTGGEPAIIGTDGLTDIKWDTIKTDVPFLGEELNDDFISTLNEAYQYLGVKSIPHKSERMVPEEVEAFAEPTTFRALDALSERRRACAELNDRFGLSVDCVWNSDLDTRNYEFLHDLEKLVSDDNSGGEGNEFDELGSTAMGED